MARRESVDSSDESLPDLDDFINTHVKKLNTLKAPKLNPPSRTLLAASPPRTVKNGPLTVSSPRKQVQTTLRSCTDSLKTTRIRPVERVQHAESAYVERTGPSVQPTPWTENTLEAALTPAKTRATPHRRAKGVTRYGATVVDLTAETDEERTDPEESVWCDSDNESYYEAPQSNLSFSPEGLQLPRRLTPDTELSDSDSDSDPDDVDSHIFDSRSPRKRHNGTRNPARETPALRPSVSVDSSDKENDHCSAALIHPPAVTYPDVSSFHGRPSTPPPPASPSKSKLISPSKKKLRIPTPPHRPSLDAFWNPHTINDWHDHYSPQKPLVSPRKDRFRNQHDMSDNSPSSSPRKSQSPSKLNRVGVDAKKKFESRKHQICSDFFAKLDEQVTEGKVSELAASTGGVQFIWSKTLQSTAGRANWRRETAKSKDADGTTITKYKQYASIELAEKVIDDEERLLNVIAHEFCHLANFMVSEIKDQPHGRQFKIWGAKVTKAFAHRGVEVTTKHAYQIDYKYVWSCTNDMCAREYKRHSKSIDPTKQTCGACRSSIVQVKPAPRKQGGKAGPGTYAAFVKEHFATIKKEMAGAPHKAVMTALGQRYREQKSASEGAAAAVGDDLARALEVISLD